MKNTSLMIIAIALCPALRASNAFSTFVAGSYNTGTSINAQDQIAQKFTAIATGDLMSLTFALGTSQAGGVDPALNFADIFVYADNAGTPGTVLETLSVNAGSFHNPAVDPQDLVVTVDSNTNPLITSGQTYWVGVQTENPSTNPIVWYEGLTTPDPGVDIFFGGAWVPESPNPTFPESIDVEVQSGVPEPATWALLGTGIGVLALRRRALPFRNR